METRGRAIWARSREEEAWKHGSMANCCEAVALLRDAKQGGDRLAGHLRGRRIPDTPTLDGREARTDEHAARRCGGTRSRRVHNQDERLLSSNVPSDARRETCSLAKGFC
jgi:hypothetical protein